MYSVIDNKNPLKSIHLPDTYLVFFRKLLSSILPSPAILILVYHVYHSFRNIASRSMTDNQFA